MKIQDEVLKLWFGNDLSSADAIAECSKRWFATDPVFDDLIRGRFGAFPAQALEGQFEDWRLSAPSTLALVLVLDQFPRNLFRGQAESFAFDSAALEVAQEALARNMDQELHPFETVFLLLPLEHAENLPLQNECVTRFEELAERAPPQFTAQFENYVEYAERHRRIIQQFSRFPHRNSILGRESTAEELQYLEAGGDTFS